MPYTGRHKAKARKSSEMDMMSNFDNLDIMIGNGIKTLTQSRGNLLIQLGNRQPCMTRSLIRI